MFTVVGCGANSTFYASGDPCPESCTSTLVPSFLNDCDSRNTVEGCQCDPGFVLEGSECVLPASCGCILDGFYAPVGLTFQTSDCSQECTCNGYDNLTCVNITCDVNAVCTSGGCMCMEGYRGDGLSCQGMSVTEVTENTLLYCEYSCEWFPLKWLCLFSIDLCFPPISISEGYFTPRLSLYQRNDVVTYYCSSDHTLVGNATRSCNGFDFGNTSFPDCYRDCNLPTAPQFSTFNNTDNSHGSVISLVCDEFYELETPGSYLVCSNGTLVGELSTCICKNFCLFSYVDECGGENDCHQNATCGDTQGSYTCFCNEGFTGDGFYCKEIRLFPFGDDQMDERLTLTAEAADQSAGQSGEREQISRTFVPPAGFPIGDNFYYSLYFLDNGLVVFINENAEKYGFPNPYPGGFDGSQSVAVVAPFWTDSSLANDQGEVFYQVYERSDSNTVNQTQVLDDADNRIRNFDPEHQQFNTSWLLVITWFEIPSFTSTSNTNTFQVGLATDGTFSFALFNYEQDEMLWNIAALASTNLIIGYNTGTGGMYVNAHLDNPPFSSVAAKFTPDQFVGNTGLGGRWIYRLEANNDTTINPKQYCLDWYSRQPPHEEWSTNLGICPCTFEQGDNDNSFQEPIFGSLNTVAAVGGIGGIAGGISSGSSSGLIASVLQQIQDLAEAGNTFCLQTAISPSGNGAGMTCCYRSDTSLIEGFGTTLDSSFAERYQYKYSSNAHLFELYLSEDFLPRDACCGLSRDPYFCGLYTEKRPAGTCSEYLPPSTTWVVGDPHFTTLDGYQYTFNGLGDYQVALIYSEGEVIYDIQGRTKQIFNQNTGQLAGATYFDAFAIKRDNFVIKFFLSDNGTDFTMNLNGSEFNKTVLLNGDYEENGFVLKAATVDLSKVLVIYLDLSAVVDVTMGLLDMVLQLPEQYRGNTRGLVGVWNGNVSDDFEFPNGTLLQPGGPSGNYTDLDFFNFGETWRVNPEDSFFDAEISRKRRNLADEAGFQPILLSNLISTFERDNPDFLASAQSTCSDNIQCLYDSLAVEDQALGEATRMSQESNEAAERVLENFPPNITADSTIIATLGELFYYQVDATDPEGSMVSYSLLFDNITANISSDGLVVWNPVSLDQVSLVVQASDGEALSAVQPTIIVCNCQNNGTCQEDIFTVDSNIIANKFAVATCACTEGWAGDFCEDDFNACLDDPCFPGITCFDNEAPLTGNRCGDGTCPEGLIGDGFKCFDLDECVFYANRSIEDGGPACQQICQNTLNGFTCSCNSGFNLHPDMYQCIDTNECGLVPPVCDSRAECTNTNGSFICTCNTGFEGDGRTCDGIDEKESLIFVLLFCSSDIDECELGQSDCATDTSELCINTHGSYECRCNAGFTSNGTDCLDIDECNTGNATQCSENANCENTYGSYACTCQDGYAGDGITCMDIDECQTGDNDCNPDTGVCSNTEGSFSCICMTGYEGDGRNCTDIDECTTDSDDCNQICNNVVGGFFCSCFSGYELDPSEPNICLDMDECALDLDNCTQGCNNTAGSYICFCMDGFIEDASGECIPQVNCTVDKCINGQCFFNQGNETCLCYNGYELSPQNDTLCVDINECEDPLLNMCDQICNNTVGAYECSCNSGYELAGNGRLCEDIDECAENIDDCNPTTSTCVNEPGTFRCACNDGFMRNGSVCQDVNECLGMNDCSANAECNNTIGSYQCTCNEGYMGNGYTCLDIDECNATGSSYANCSSNAVCANEVGSFTCTCLDGYDGDGRTCVDVDECSLPSSDPRAANCDPDATCSNLEGSFTCACNDGYSGNGTFCEDINECNGVNTCVVNSMCANIPGSFVCTCNSGFRGDALVLCEDIDECEENLDGCDENAECTNFIGGYSCDCNPGFSGDGFTCNDQDECANMNLNECHPLADCDNTFGSYYCTCQTGYVSTSTPAGRTCEDFNECSLNPCDTNEECINTFGSYACTCIDGYEEVNGTCVDINECITRPCANIPYTRCENTMGGYNCICQTGFYAVNGNCSTVKSYSIRATFTDIKGINVNTDLYTPEFEDENKPILQADLIALFEMSSLTNFLGITIRSCNSLDMGVDITFTVDLTPNTSVTLQEVEMTFVQGLTGRGNNIVDPDSVLLFDTVFVGEPIFNPCEEQTDNCTTNAECIFMGNSYNYTCQCNEGFMGDGFVSCTDVDECEDDPCTEVGEVCVNNVGSYTCECRKESGYFREGGLCVLYKAFQGEFTIVEVNKDPGLAVFLDAYSDPTSLEYKILENRVCGSVRYSYLFEQMLQQYFVECFVDMFSPGSIQAVWTVLFNLGVDTTAADLEVILLQSIMNEVNGDGVLTTGTQTLGNLTLIVDTVDIDGIVTECPEGYCFNGGTCSVVQSSYVCYCPDGYNGDRCEISPTTQPAVVTTASRTEKPSTSMTTFRPVTTTQPVTEKDVTTSRPDTSRPLTTQSELVETSEEPSASPTEMIITPTVEEPGGGLEDWQVVAIIIIGISILLSIMICCLYCCICVIQRRQPKKPTHFYPDIDKYFHPDPRILHPVSVSGHLPRGDVYSSRRHHHYYDDGYIDDDTSSYDTWSIDSLPDHDERMDSYRDRKRLRHLSQIIHQSAYLNMDQHEDQPLYSNHPQTTASAPPPPQNLSYPTVGPGISIPRPQIRFNTPQYY
ncbi:Mucin-like protein [Holothuria leucospilota]|uniref:Mucin-like protein n=1 Tax=Holothuria leucospilota TaxID=206669 RepID=A0A9Q1C5X4_HOLLE|nr:Mucin-like protein [Holothuria leucospilota]